MKDAVDLLNEQIADLKESKKELEEMLKDTMRIQYLIIKHIDKTLKEHGDEYEGQNIKRTRS